MKVECPLCNWVSLPEELVIMLLGRPRGGEAHEYKGMWACGEPGTGTETQAQGTRTWYLCSVSLVCKRRQDILVFLTSKGGMNNVSGEKLF